MKGVYELSKRRGLFKKGHKGYINSGSFVKGNVPTNLGKRRPHTDETKKKISESNKGKKRPRTAEHQKKIALAHVGKPATWNKGEKSHFWKGGVSKQNRTYRQNIMVSIEYKIWRKAVFERDNYTCVWCGIRGVEINADHIKPFAFYPELRLAIDNGRTLCVPCHKTTESYGKRK